MTERTEAVAKAIFSTWAFGYGAGLRGLPGDAAAQRIDERWNKLKPLARDRWFAEADAAIRAMEAFKR